MRMRKEVKDAWVAALRSGKYKQGKMALCSAEKFCCLGVLVDINLEPLNMAWNVDIDPRAGILPLGLGQVLGIDLATQTRLAQLNDEGWAFEEIAHEIEESL